MSPEGRRVLVLATTFPAKRGDGTPEFVLALAGELATDHRVTVLVPRVRGAARRERIEGLDVHRFAYFPRRWEGLADGAILPNLRASPWRVIEVLPFVAAFSWSAWRLSRRSRPDIVHAHWIIPAGAIASLIKRVFAVPFVLTVHGADAFALGMWPLRWLKGRIIQSADAVVPVSRDIADHLGIDDAASVVPMGVDVESLRDTMGRRDPQQGRFLFVGRLVQKKGVEVLLDALTVVPEAHLVIVGDGPERPALEAQVSKNGLTDRVDFLGKQPQRAVAEELGRCQAIIVPSVVARGGDKDGMPLVVAEAVAGGVPIIASRLGGIAEVLDDETAVLLTPGSIEELAAAIQRASSYPDESESLGASGYRKKASALDIGTIAAHYRVLIARLTSELT